MNQKEVAGRLGLTTRTVRRLEDRGLPREPDGSYRWDSVFSWYVGFKQEEAVRRHKANQPGSYDQARTRREMARARMAEIDLAKEEGEIIRREAADQAYGEAMDRIRAALMNMPGRFATHLIDLDSPRQAEAVLKRVSREMLEYLSGPVADEVAGDADDLPEDFPGRAALEDAGIGSVEEVVHMETEDLEDVHGIGPVTAAKIEDRLQEAAGAV